MSLVNEFVGVNGNTKRPRQMADESLIALKRQIAALPAGNAPDYAVGPPGRNIRLYAEPFYLLQDRNRLRLRGTITYRWFPHPQVRFRGSTRKRGVVLEPGNGELWIPRLLRVPVLVTSIQYGVSLTASGLVQKVARVGQDRPVSSVKFHLPNFHRYVGERVRHGLRSTSTSRIRLHAGRWLIDLDQVPQFVTLEQQLRDRGELL